MGRQKSVFVKKDCTNHVSKGFYIKQERERQRERRVIWPLHERSQVGRVSFEF